MIPMFLLLARTLASPRLGREPKVKVVANQMHETTMVVEEK
jgi:hypothetical protein